MTKTQVQLSKNNKDKFNKNYPKFNWRNYIDFNEDLNHIVNEDAAIIHYKLYGHKENRVTIINNFDDSLNKIGFEQCVLSDFLSSWSIKLRMRFNLRNVIDNEKPCIFIGIFTKNDFTNFTNYKGIKGIIWVNQIKYDLTKGIINVCFDERIQKELKHRKIFCHKIPFTFKRSVLVNDDNIKLEGFNVIRSDNIDDKFLNVNNIFAILDFKNKLDTKSLIPVIDSINLTKHQILEKLNYYSKFLFTNYKNIDNNIVLFITDCKFDFTDNRTISNINILNQYVKDDIIVCLTCNDCIDENIITNIDRINFCNIYILKSELPNQHIINMLQDKIVKIIMDTNEKYMSNITTLLCDNLVPNHKYSDIVPRNQFKGTDYIYFGDINPKIDEIIDYFDKQNTIHLTICSTRQMQKHDSISVEYIYSINMRNIQQKIVDSDYIISFKESEYATDNVLNSLDDIKKISKIHNLKFDYNFDDLKNSTILILLDDVDISLVINVVNFYLSRHNIVTIIAFFDTNIDKYFINTNYTIKKSDKNNIKSDIEKNEKTIYFTKQFNNFFYYIKDIIYLFIFEINLEEIDIMNNYKHIYHNDESVIDFVGSNFEFKPFLNPILNLNNIKMTNIDLCDYYDYLSIINNNILVGEYIKFNENQIISDTRDVVVYNMSDIINKNINTSNRIIVINNNDETYDIYEFLFKSVLDHMSHLDFLVDFKRVPKSNELLHNKYITPICIDHKIYNNFKTIIIYGKNIDSFIVKDKDISNLVCDDDLYINSKIYIEPKNKIFKNRIALISDSFTYNSFKDILDVDYISKKDIKLIDVSRYDLLFCDSTWDGIDSTWRYCFSNKDHLSEIKALVDKFKKKNIKTIYFNKEDPIHFDKFVHSAILFDIIITTSEDCVKKYRTLNNESIIFSNSFYINPKIHNPIIYQDKKNEYVFAGGFYKKFNQRYFDTFNILNTFINKGVKVFNRHYFLNNKTFQLDKLIKCNHKGNYEIPKMFKHIELPTIPAGLVTTEIYKTYKYQLNLNTVINDKTMSSRRAIELAGCGANIISNKSTFLKSNFNNCMSFIGEENTNNDVINKKIFYKTHLNFSCVSLFEKIYGLINVDLVYIKSIEFVVSKFSTTTLKSNVRSNIKVYLNKKGYHYDDIFIKKILSITNFWDGNIYLTNDIDKEFRIFDHQDTSLDKCCYVLGNEDTNLFINNIHTRLYENCYDETKDYNDININLKDLDKDGILVVMCTWKRISKLIITLKCLNDSDINKINFVIFNNNHKINKQIKNIVDKYKGRINVILHNNNTNIGGIGRFVVTKYITKEIYDFKKVIFIDDDQIFENDFISTLLDNYVVNEATHWFGKKFNNRGYWDCHANLWHGNIDFLDYGGTGGMIINTSVFLHKYLFKFNIKYLFIEDLWLSYFIQTKLQFKIRDCKHIRHKIHVDKSDDYEETCQYKHLKNLKIEFLNVLREDGDWEV
jgi:hypothetical protein